MQNKALVMIWRRRIDIIEQIVVDILPKTLVDD